MAGTQGKIAAAGALLGLGCALADRMPYSPHVLGTVPGWLGNIAGTWIVAAAMTGALSPTPRSALAAGPLLLASAVGVYYGFIVVAGARTEVPAAAQLSAALAWLLLGVLTGLTFGWLGHGLRAGTARWRQLAAGALGASLAVESLNYLVRSVPSAANPYYVLYALELTAGVATAVLLGWGVGHVAGVRRAKA